MNFSEGQRRKLCLNPRNDAEIKLKEDLPVVLKLVMR
jgi:hypothetical protein